MESPTDPERASDHVAAGRALRLFFAVELPAEVQAALGKLMPRGEVDRDYRWVSPHLLHVTLAFLGSQPVDRLDLLRDVAREAAAASTLGRLRLGKPGTFPPRGIPRVLWIGLEGDLAALNAVQQRLVNGLRPAGFTLEDRPFSPHITLARRRQNARGGPPPDWPSPATHASDTASATSNSRHIEFPMQELTLFESRLSPRGATYLALDRFALH